MMNLSKKTIVVCVALLIIGMILYVILTRPEPLEKGERRLYEDTQVKLDEGKYDFYRLYGRKNDRFWISLWVYEGNNVDVYILTSSELKEYKLGKSFNASFSQENKSSVNESWTQPTGGDYYIVVDNVDNVHSSDAKPNGTVTYSIEGDNASSEIRNLEFFLYLGVGFIVTVVSIAIVLGIRDMIRGKRVL